MDKLLKSSFGKYTIVGAVGALVEYCSFLALFATFKDSAIKAIAESAANAAAMFLGALFCYFLNRVWSFKSKGKMASEATRYFSLLAFNVVVSSVALKMICSSTGLEPWLVKVPLMAVVFLWNFLAARFWVYRSPKEQPSKEQQ